MTKKMTKKTVKNKAQAGSGNGLNAEEKEKGPAPREFKLPKKTKVAIVGCADSNKQVPFDRADEFEFWGVNNLYLTMPLGAPRPGRFPGPGRR